MGTLITAEELHRLIDAEDPSLRILDIRWRLDKPDGHADYLQGHIPGAMYVDMDTELAEHGRPATDGRHPLPTLETLQTAARRWGLNDGDTVVVYDDIGNAGSARAWWLLRQAGVSDVRVLDGALHTWKSAGLPLENGEITPGSGNITLNFESLRALNIDQAAAFGQHGTLLDARAPERYRGEHEPLDPQAGHIPGALNAPITGNIGEDHRFLSPGELRERFLALGVDPDTPVAAYCGSGISATHTALALELAGFDAVVYPGSFSEWSNHPEREVATGNQPG